MSETFHAGNRVLQDRFDTRRIADRIDSVLVSDTNGEAGIDEHDPLMPDYPEAQFIVRVRATEVFPNCPRYIHRYRLERRSSFVPRAGCATPVPEWKRSDRAIDALPRDDPALDPGDRDVLGR